MTEAGPRPAALFVSEASKGTLEIVRSCHARIVANWVGDPKHQRTFFLGVWAPPPRLTVPLGLVRAGLFLFTKKNATPVGVSSADRDK